MFSIGEVNGLDPFSVVVKGTGDPDTDNANIISAVSKLNGWGKGTLYIDGSVYVTTNQNFTAPISLRGLGTDAKIIGQNSASFFTPFSWNRDFVISSLTQYDISTPKTKMEYIDASGTGWTPQIGEYILVWSEDTIPGVEPHGGTYAPKPMELHMVGHYNASNYRAYLSDFVVDQLSTSGKLAVMPLYDGIKIDNLEFEHSGSQGTFTNCVFLQTCKNVFINNIRIGRNGCGAIYFNFCANVYCNDITMEGTARYDSVYGFVAGVVNGLKITNSHIHGTRHGFTTTSGYSTATKRYGTPLNVVIDNVNAYCYPVENGGTLTSRIMFDTHAEGWNVTFQNCTVITTHRDVTSIGYAFQTRSRKTTIKNCRVIGCGEDPPGSYSSTNVGVRVYGDDCLVENCSFENLWYGVETSWSFLTGICSNRLTVKNCTFKNIYEWGIRLKCGSGHWIDDCEFINVGHVATRNMIQFENPTRSSGVTTISNCYFQKPSTNYRAINQSGFNTSVIEVYGNLFDGNYGAPEAAGPLGFAPTETGAEFEDKYRASNSTNKGHGNRKEGQDALGLISGVTTINFDDDNYDNKSCVLDANVTLTLEATRAGNYYLLISQDDEGGHTITWNNIAWTSTEVQPPTGVFEHTAINFYYDGEEFHGFSY